MRALFSLMFAAFPTMAFADGPADNQPDNVRRVPPPGIQVPGETAAALNAGLERLFSDLEQLRAAAKIRPELNALIPDVEVYYKAIHDALKYNEFFNEKELGVARDLLKTGLERAALLRDGKHPWAEQTGLVIRGYRSKIDGSVQPYGLAIPKGYDFKTPIRLDLWCHGRGENLSELNFIQSNQRSGGPFVSDKAIVLNLYGRYCCANKLAGEVDCFEALEAVKKHYAIDVNRLVIRGFSMGGAACWQFAVHYPSTWCAAAPGAGFAETAEFLHNFQNEKVAPTWFEKKLWHMYDCTDYALNLSNVPTVAYSGELDTQKQAADIMARAMKREGLELTHLIGPKTKHEYEKNAKAELIARIDAIAEKGRNPAPAKLQFVTYTLRYNACFWLTLEGLDQHWERAQVDAMIEKDKLELTTRNVNALSLNMPPSASLLQGLKSVVTEIDGQKMAEELPVSPTAGLQATLVKRGGKWSMSAARVRDAQLSKRPGLQGPIDDAFLSSFLMVRPTGLALNEALEKWSSGEMKHAASHWRQQFRGEAPMKNDRDITDEDIRNNNLILWGDVSSNSVLKRIADNLPIAWKNGKLVVGAKSYEAASHAPVLIFPNPLNPEKYVVLNSGFTFREYDYLNNARQIPKLPDFAIIDMTTPPNSRWPGRVVEAGFFDENWRLPEAYR